MKCIPTKSVEPFVIQCQLLPSHSPRIPCCRPSKCVPSERLRLVKRFISHRLLTGAWGNLVLLTYYQRDVANRRRGDSFPVRRLRYIIYRDIANRRCGDAAAAELQPHFEFSEREGVDYFQLKASVTQSVSRSVSQSQITVIIMLISVENATWQCCSQFYENIWNVAFSYLNRKSELVLINK